jgi:hypothetical protein
VPYSGLLGDALGGGGDDFTTRLRRRHGVASADPGMVAQPPVDPGYAMPNVDLGNLNQMPGQDVSGWLPTSDQQQLLLRALQTLTRQS